MSMNVVEKIDDLVQFRNVMANFFDNGGLDGFIP